MLTVEPLPRKHIRAVYPLIREAVPGLSLSDWLRFARPITGVRRNMLCGIIIARREASYFPNGLFCYRVERDMMANKILVAEHFIAVDLLYPHIVLDALVAELDGLGRRLGCSAVRSVVHGPDIEGGLTLAGHAASGSLHWKTLADRETVTVPGAGRA